MLQPVSSSCVRPQVRALILVAVFAGVASADVAWNAPVGCPSAEAVRARIGDLDLRVDVARDGGRFVAHLALGEETRELTARRCDDLADAVVVIVARLARAQHTVVVVEDEPPPAVLDVEMPAVYVRRVPSPVPPLPLPTQDDHWGFGMRLTGLSGIGAVPEVGVGAELAGYLRHDDHFVEVGAATWQSAPQSMKHVGLQVATIRAGWAPRELPLRVWGQGEMGGLEGETEMERWTAVGGGFGVAWPMHPNARLIGSFEAVVPVERPSVEGYEPSAIATRVSFGIEVGWK